MGVNAMPDGPAGRTFVQRLDVSGGKGMECKLDVDLYKERPNCNASRPGRRVTLSKVGLISGKSWWWWWWWCAGNDKKRRHVAAMIRSEKRGRVGSYVTA